MPVSFGLINPIEEREVPLPFYTWILGDINPEEAELIRSRTKQAHIIYSA
ncbi:hypothetical protein PP178_13230 [Zeaxanthinibacter sp. PT1]|nr:hypothetical protein [Zeaxanthinibacter sp. PT1]MDC6352517.1 hypothetical protein [Zeaxanthinibacter sp. PT1]